MIIVVSGRSILTEAEAASGMFIQGGPLNQWYRTQPFDPTPWLLVIKEEAPPAEPPSTTTSVKTLTMRLYASLPDSGARLAFLQEMGNIALEDMDGEVETSGLVRYGFSGLKAVPDFGKHEYGKIAAALAATRIDFAPVSMQPYDVIAGGGATVETIIHWRNEHKVAVLAINRGNGKRYKGWHNMTLVENSPEVFAVEVQNALT